jgi:hypothetical protein
LRPSQWILDRTDPLETAIADVEAANSDLLASVGITNVTPAAEALRNALRQAVGEQGALLEEQLIGAPIADERVRLFSEHAHKGWQQHGTARHLLQWGGSFEEIEGENPDVRFGYAAYEPKSPYVDDHTFGLDNHAEQVGRVVADGENSKLWEIIKQAQALRRVSGDINQRLDKAIASMQQKGYHPNVIFVPWRRWWRPPELKLRPVDEKFSTLGAERSILGLFRDLLVFEITDLSNDRVIVADLRSLTVFRQWKRAEGVLVVNVTPYDEESALAAVRGNRRLMREPGVTRMSDRARKLRKAVWIEVTTDFKIELSDAKAVRAMLLPPDLAQRYR